MISAAQRAADPTPVIGAAHRASADRLPLAAESWLHREHLRTQLGLAVRISLTLAEVRYTGREVDGYRFAPGTMSLPDALHNAGAKSCYALGLGRAWVPFVEVHAAHAIARANELPPGAGPLDDRVPAYMADLMRLEAITVADTLFIAHADYTYNRPEEPPTAASPRALAARRDAPERAGGNPLLRTSSPGVGSPPPARPSRR